MSKYSSPDFASTLKPIRVEYDVIAQLRAASDTSETTVTDSEYPVSALLGSLSTQSPDSIEEPVSNV